MPPMPEIELPFPMVLNRNPSLCDSAPFNFKQKGGEDEMGFASEVLQSIL
jgi:hypothetical protein